MNSCTIYGRLGQDAEYQTTQSGTGMLKFSVANNTGYGDKKQTNWFRCVMWGERGAKLVEYLKKGAAVVVTGEVTMNTYESKKDGIEVSSLNLNVRDLSFAEKKDTGEAELDTRTQRKAADSKSANAFDDSDTIPF